MLLHTHGLQWDRSNGCKTGFWFLPQPCLLPPLPYPACLGQALGGWWRCCVLFLSINLPSVWGIRISLFRAWHAQVTEWWACVGIDVSEWFWSFWLGAPEMLGSPPREWPVGLMPTVLSEVTQDTWSRSRCSELYWNTSMMKKQM